MKSKTREINIVESKGSFSIFKNAKLSKKDYDYSGLTALRNLLNNEKARIIHTIKTKHPKSIYELAKILGRTFKSVKDDLTLLERFGFVELSQEKTKNRIRHKPEVLVDSIVINVKI